MSIVPNFTKIFSFFKLNEWALKRLEVVDANVVDQKRAILGTLPTLLKFELITAEKFENEIGPLKTPV